jgi:hypothetical protein
MPAWSSAFVTGIGGPVQFALGDVAANPDVGIFIKIFRKTPLKIP